MQVRSTCQGHPGQIIFYEVCLFLYSVCEGPPHRRGVYVQTTEEGSVARVAGIKSGDRILHCNGMDMTSVDFDEVYSILELLLFVIVTRTTLGIFF